MIRTISIVLLAGAVLHTLMDGFHTGNIILIALGVLMLLLSLLTGKPAAEAKKRRSLRNVTAIVFGVYILCLLAVSAFFQPENIYSVSRRSDRAASLIAAGNYDKAEEILLKLYEKNTSDPAVNLNLGVVYLSRHESDKARAHFEHAAYGMNFNEQLYYDLGLVYYQKKDYGNARNHFERAVQLNPDFLKANIYAGTMNYRVGDMKRSVYYLQNAEFLAPDSPEVLMLLGRSHAGLMEYDKALDCYNRALEHKPGKELEKSIREQIEEIQAITGGAAQ